MCIKKVQADAILLFALTFIHLPEDFIQSDLQMRTMEVIIIYSLGVLFLILEIDFEKRYQKVVVREY